MNRAQVTNPINDMSRVMSRVIPHGRMSSLLSLSSRSSGRIPFAVDLRVTPIKPASGRNTWDWGILTRPSRRQIGRQSGIYIYIRIGSPHVVLIICSLTKPDARICSVIYDRSKSVSNLSIGENTIRVQWGLYLAGVSFEITFFKCAECIDVQNLIWLLVHLLTLIWLSLFSMIIINV